MSLNFVMYQSRALVPNTAHEHNLILEACNRRNKTQALTGFLHRESDLFLQYLEGPEDQLNETLARISKDERHTNVQVLHKGALDQRHFPDWQMGFVDSSQLTLASLLLVKGRSLNLLTQDWFDLVVFLSNNADALRGRQAA